MLKNIVQWGCSSVPVADAEYQGPEAGVHADKHQQALHHAIECHVHAYADGLHTPACWANGAALLGAGSAGDVGNGAVAYVKAEVYH